MSRPPDGGNTTSIDSGGAGLEAAATAVDSIGDGFTQGGGSAASGSGDAEIAAALHRYTAAATAMTSGIHTQLAAAGQLARHAAADLTAVGGH